MTEFSAVWAYNPGLVSRRTARNWRISGEGVARSMTANRIKDPKPQPAPDLARTRSNPMRRSFGSGQRLHVFCPDYGFG